MSPISLAYILVFLPIIFAIINYFFSNNLVSRYLFLFCNFTLAITSTIIIKNLSENINYSSGSSLLSLALEISITREILFFIIMISLIQIFLRLIIKNIDNDAYKNDSLRLVMIFSINGIAFSSNLINILFFLEIYLLSQFKVFLNHGNKNFIKQIRQYFVNYCAASILLMISFLIIFLNFNSFDLSILREKVAIIHNYNLLKILSIIIIALLAIIMVPVDLIKFLIKKFSLSNIYFLGIIIFFNFNIGFLILRKVDFLIFNNSTIYLLGLVALCLFLYSIYFVTFGRYMKMFFMASIFSSISLIIFAFLINIQNLNNFYLYWVNFNFINLILLFYLFYLQNNFKNTLLQNYFLISRSQVIAVFSILFFVAIIFLIFITNISYISFALNQLKRDNKEVINYISVFSIFAALFNQIIYMKIFDNIFLQPKTMSR